MSVTEHVKRNNGPEKFYYELSGDSTDSKPTADVVDGSIFLETDTGKVYFFNGKTSEWVEQFSFQG